MNLELHHIHRPTGERLSFPFGQQTQSNGFNEQWWSRDPVYPDSERIYLQATMNEVEVARIELNPSFSIQHYADTPTLGDKGLEIAFFEVHEHHRCSSTRIGTRIIKLLTELYPHHRFAAFSEQADGFWASLGWREHLHANPEEIHFYRPLYIQPPCILSAEETPTEHSQT